MTRLLLLLAALLATPAHADTRSFGGWAVGVVAGDWRSGEGRPIAAFENARRDIAAGLVRAGFSPANLVQFSPNPAVGTGLLPATSATLSREWMAVTERATAGCLLYLTSHGNPQGIVLGARGMLGPTGLDMLLDLSCGDRPTVVVVSACYSGVFVDPLAAPNRLVLTAARRDRSSFGCGEDSTYPYFDACVLEALPDARDMLVLAAAARRCVARRETAERLTPPSEPQLAVGATMRALAPTLRLTPD